MCQLKYLSNAIETIMYKPIMFFQKTTIVINEEVLYTNDGFKHKELSKCKNPTLWAHFCSVLFNAATQKSFRLYGSTVWPWNSVPKHDLQFKPFRPISHTLVKTIISYSVTLFLFLLKKNHLTQILNGLLRKKIHRNIFFVFNDQESKLKKKCYCKNVCL